MTLLHIKHIIRINLEGMFGSNQSSVTWAVGIEFAVAEHSA
jgi:hypothetical protein